MDNESSNPYENHYKSLGFNINEQITSQEAENISRQLGLMYNAVGIVIKDITKLLSFKFSEKKSSGSYKASEEKAKEIADFLSSSEIQRRLKIPNIETIKKTTTSEKVQIHFENEALNDPLSSQSFSLPQQEMENEATLAIYEARIDPIINIQTRSYGKTAKKGSKMPREDFETFEKKPSQNNFISLDDD